MSPIEIAFLICGVILALWCGNLNAQIARLDAGLLSMSKPLKDAIAAFDAYDADRSKRFDALMEPLGKLLRELQAASAQKVEEDKAL